MITENDVHDQMAHFSKCGRCIQYLQERGVDPRFVNLHPLLIDFLAFAKKRQFTKNISQIFDSTDFIEVSEDVLFHRFIEIVGNELGRTFLEFLDSDVPTSLIEDYEEKRQIFSRSAKHSDMQRSRDQQRNRDLQQSRDGFLPDGTQILGFNESLDTAADRLVNSVYFLTNGDFYQDQVQHSPEVLHLFRALGIATKYSIQAVEFVSWAQDNHPDLDLLSSMPVNQIEKLIVDFCEEKNYQNVSSFTKEVKKLLQGNGENRALRMLEQLSDRIRRKNNTFRPAVSPFERYKSVPYHAIFLFLSAGNFPEFINTYWEDINHLTGDYLDVYYSYADLEHRVSGYETINEFRSIQIDAIALPAILIWKKTLTDSCIISLQKLTNDDVFDILKLIVQRIKNGNEMQVFCNEARVLVDEKVEAYIPAPRIIIREGGVFMSKSGDTYNVGQAGAVGPNSHAHDIVFNQSGQQFSDNIDLAKLAQELSVLRGELKKNATTPEQDLAVGAVASAEIEAQKGNGQKVMEYLFQAGKWAFDTATKIGITLAAEALKQSLGLK